MPTAILSQEGRALSVGDGGVNITNVYYLVGYSNENEVLKTAFGASVSDGAGGFTSVPRLGSQHNVFKVLQASSYTLTHVVDTQDVWRAEFTFEAFSGGGTGGITAGSEEHGFTEWTARITASFTLAYRANPAIAGTESPTDANIGGQACDAGGQPTSVLRVQTEIVKSVVSTQPSGAAVIAEQSRVGKLTTLSGISGLLYRGVQIQRISQNKYRLSYTYLGDTNMHCIQTPVYYPDGTFDRDQDGHVDHVRWVQPFHT